MKNTKRNGLLVTAIFVVGCVLSGLMLIQLESDLALEAGVLDVGEMEKANPFFLRVHLAIFATFIVGIFGFYFLQRNQSQEVIYVDRKSNDHSKKEKQEGEQYSADTQANDVASVFKNKKAKDPEDMFKAICDEIEAVSGAYYGMKAAGASAKLELDIPYALSFGESSRPAFEIGEGLVGQSAKEKRALFVDDIPPSAIMAKSGLGESQPLYLAILPVIHEDKVQGICEIGTFKPIDKEHQQWLADATNAFGKKVASTQTRGKEKIKES